MKLVEQLEQVERDELVAAWESYTEIVRRPEPVEGDAQRLRAICERLQITTDDVQQDMAAWAHMPKLEQDAAESDVLMGESQKASDKLRKRLAKFQDDDKKGKEELTVLRRTTLEIQHKLELTRRAGESIKTLSERRWRIFDQPKPWPLEDFHGIERTEQQVEHFLSDQPPSVRMAHDCDARTRRCLKAHGYSPGRSGVWVYGDAPEIEHEIKENPKITKINAKRREQRRAASEAAAVAAVREAG